MTGNGSNGNELWKRVAIALLSVFGTIMGHIVLGVDNSSRTGGTSTGWSKDQEQHFLYMPSNIDTAVFILRRVESDIVELQKYLNK